ncbi:MAG TPA: CPBP family glutamic-type intramembrane protease [Spirochaetia bacterium]|nr:CPBP family glutamic-type intramembrane protease [Spirochaetia bacterium]
MAWLSTTLNGVVSVITDPYAAVFMILGVSYLLLSSVLNVHNLKRNAEGDFKPVMTYFTSVFGLLFLAPLVVILLTGRATGVTPASLGLGLGNWRLGLLLGAILLPLLLTSVYLGRKDPVLRDYYPFSKEAMESPGRFVLYEMSYLFMYYLPWEFTFRGVILFGLMALLPHTLAGLVIAVMVQTFLSTMFHLGHPDSEVFGAFLMGLIAGTATAFVGSIFYVLFHHALAGILNDVLVYRKLTRGRHLGRETA